MTVNATVTTARGVDIKAVVTIGRVGTTGRTRAAVTTGPEVATRVVTIVHRPDIEGVTVSESGRRTGGTIGRGMELGGRTIGRSAGSSGGTIGRVVRESRRFRRM